MAEYVMQPGDDPGEVARMLLDRSTAPEHVMWSPRPDTPGGGVFVVHDEEVAGAVARERQEMREAEAKRIADAQAAAEERDAQADETGLTPAELGFPANAGTDPGSAGEAERNAEVTAEAQEGEAADRDEVERVEPAEGEQPAEEGKTTTAQRRAARAAKKAEAEAPEEGK